MNEMAAVYVRLLSPACFKVASKQLSPRPEKRFQLLVYMAYRGDWVSRERLAYLFWPDTTTERAQQNLRALLYRVKSLEWLEGLEVEGQKLRWPVETDVAAFRRALDQGDLDGALSLYTGPLLEGLESDAAPEFSAWLEIEREHLQSLWRDALLRRVRDLQEQGKHGDAAKLLKVLLEHDPLDEEALAAYLSAASLAGQRKEALAAYHDFTSRLQAELGIEPTSTTQSVAQAIRERDDERLAEMSPAPPGSSTLGISPFTTPATSFVGRDLELSGIAHLLSKLNCRLLTLTGPGGIGKTRLARRAAEKLAGRYSDGSAFATLDSLSSPGAIAATVAQVLELELSGQDEPLAQLVRAIGNKHMLLVLDNFEHLLEGAPVASRLVQACSKLDVLVTSRERLDLVEEWLLTVGGLPFPVETTATSTETWASDATTLFTQRASQVHPAFVPTEDDLRHIAEIYRLVEGSPLALELAAVWVRMMSCQEIAEEIQANIDILSTSSRNLPERHKSLRATFEHSWTLLRPLEREVLRNLSVFKGGFRKEAASVVAGASITVLASLVDKSLLRLTATGRYDCHPLVYGYTEEKLAEHPDEQAEVQTKHSKYYFRFLQERNLEMKGKEQKEGLLAMAEELENIRAAWQWAVAEPRVEELREAIEPLTVFYDRQARYAEGIDLLGEAQASLSEADSHHRLALGNALVGQAFLHQWSSNYEEAVRLAQRGLDLLRPLGEGWGVMVGIDTLGFAAAFTGNFAEGKRCWADALALAKAQNNAVKTAELLSIMGVTEAWQGNRAAAKAYMNEAMKLTPGLGKHTAVIYILLNQGFVNVLDDPKKAQLAFRQALELTRELGYRRHLPYLLYGLGWSLCLLGHYSEAQVLCRQAIEVAQESGNVFAPSMALAILGKATAELHDHSQAQGYLEQSLRLSQLAQSTFAMPVTLAYLAALWIEQGRAEQAAEVLGFILHQLTAISFAQAIAESLVTELKDKLPVETLTAALERGKTVRLEEVVERILRQPPLHP